MVKPDILSAYYTFSEAQQNLLLSVESQLCDVLGVKRHQYLVRMRLVGRTPSEFRPAIVLATSSIRTKDALTKYLLRGPTFMTGLRACQLDLHVILASAGAACSLDQITSDIKRTQGISVMVGTPGPCGARMLVQSPHEDKSRLCVAGGFLVVNGEEMFTASNHTIACAEDMDSIWHSAAQIPDLSTMPEEYKAPFSVYHDELKDSSLCSDDTNQVHSSTSHPDGYPSVWSGTTSSDTKSIAEPVQAPKLSSMTRDDLHAAEDCEYTPAHIQHRTNLSDCVTLKVQRRNDLLSPPIASINTIGGFIINEVHHAEISSSLPVTIALPEGEVTGKLCAETVFYTVGERRFKLKSITTDLPLERGCSGAWVAHKNQLCGAIIAVNDDEPEVFILPFDQIIEDLKRISGGSVHLPQTSNRTSTLSSILDVNRAHTDVSSSSFLSQIEYQHRRC